MQKQKGLNMKKLLTIDVAVVRMHFNILERNGVPQKILEDTLGFSREDIKNDDILIPFKKNFQMLKKGLELTEPTMALKIGKMYSLQKVGIIGQLLKNCRNLEEASYQFLRYQSFYYGSSIFKLALDDSYSVLKHSIVQTVYCNEDDEKRLITELNLSSCVALIRQLTNENFNPKEMHFSYKKPEYIDAYEAYFRSFLKFNQKEDSIVFRKEQFKIPIPDYQPYLKDILTQYADAKIAKLESNIRFQDKVRQIMMELLPKGILSIEMVSEKLNMSRWTLTRKLRKEGTTFKNLLKTQRKEMALNYLANKKLSISEIAFLLGYSEVSAFQRAFKNWTGKNPLKFKDQ